MKNKLIVQDNALTTARYEMTALEKNIMYAVMDQIEDSDLPTKFYTVSIADISQYTDKRLRNDDFKDATVRLLTRELIIKRPNGNILQTTIISSAEYDDKGDVEIGIDLKMRPYLFALKNNFTVFGLEVAMSLKSKYSKRLYEMLCQFKSTGLLRISIQELRERFELLEDQYERWSNFEKNVLKTAQTEINAKAEFQFDYTLKRRKNKIVSIDFIFRKPEAKPEPKPVIVLPVPVIAPALTVACPAHFDPTKFDRTVERFKNFGLNVAQINKIFAHSTQQAILKQLYDLDLIKDTVRNPSAYLLTIFGIQSTPSV